MKQIAPLALVLSLACLPAGAQENEPQEPVAEGFSLMEEGARLLFRGMMDEMQPAIDEFTGMAQEMRPTFELLAQEMGPALAELLRQVDSIRYYDAPQFLPNGDIIMRRKPDAPVWEPPAADADDATGGDTAIDL